MSTLVTLANFYFRGITNDSTALLMLKRAKKLKGRKQQEKRLLGRHIHPSIHPKCTFIKLIKMHMELYDFIDLNDLV